MLTASEQTNFSGSGLVVDQMSLFHLNKLDFYFPSDTLLFHFLIQVFQIDRQNLGLEPARSLSVLLKMYSLFLRILNPEYHAR